MLWPLLTHFTYTRIVLHHHPNLIYHLSLSETAEPQCNDSDQYPFYLLEGEAFYFVHLNLPKRNYSNEEVTWHRNNSRIENIYDENERIHCHGGALFFLNLLIEDSGFYTAR